MLQNAYQWRGRVKRKRGTSFLNRLSRYFDSTIASFGSTSYLTLSTGAASLGYGNLLTGFNLQVTGNIISGSITITDTTSSIIYTDPGKSGILVGNPTGSGTVNYASGEITIVGAGGDVIQLQMQYYPVLPVMGIEDFALQDGSFPGTIAFDISYAYKISTSSPYIITPVNFYKNPPGSSLYPGYTPKSVWTPTTWNGADYQQFWTTNYQGALWATNGIDVPFTGATIGMQFAGPSTSPDLSAAIWVSSTTINFTIIGSPLVVGDFVYANEFIASGGGNANAINFQAGYVTVVSGSTITVKFPFANIPTGTYTPGILQYLTNRSNLQKDCLRWYDGDPTNDNIPQTFAQGAGWVNFMPPISQSGITIADAPKAQYYLVGARMILPFKDRLLFFGPVVQTSSGSPIYLQDTVIYSQNGTPYYTSSFNGSPTSSGTGFSQILVPNNQTATAPAYFADSTGFGGFVTAGLDQPIITVSPNEDVLLLGFNPTYQVRFVYTGNDILPFNFFIVNSELGSASTFSAITLDKGVLSRGARGIVESSQVDVRRIDVEIPDEVFEINLLNNGNERFTAQRDFINEWIYFTYNSNSFITNSRFPNQTLLYNYRDSSYAIFIESYTSYGAFRKQTGYTWATIDIKYPTWASWNVPWNAGASTLLQPEIVAGNQQGFLVIKEDSTNESNSLQINNFSFPTAITGISQAASAVVTMEGNFQVGQSITFSNVMGMVSINGLTGLIIAVTPTTVTVSINSSGFAAYTSGGTATPFEPVYSPNHGLNQGDYIVISGVIGGLASQVNGKVYRVFNVTIDGFNIETPPPTVDTYFGGGLIKRMYVPVVQTKQFPPAWGLARKTRLGVQQYLLSKTNTGQITLQIFLSQDASNAYNEGPIIPGIDIQNSGLIYSQTLFTCPESTNLGLTPLNTNLQQLTAISSDNVSSNAQQQIWHRVNTSLIGDTIQIGFTLSDDQMRDPNLIYQFDEIELHSFILDVSPSALLS